MSPSFKRSGRVWRVLCAVCAALALSANAASFDCAKASTKVEHIICDSPEISKLDDEMAKTYSEALEKRPIENLLTQHQREWLSGRNRCKDISCLRNAYKQRIAKLNESYTLVMSKDDKLCKSVLAFYNEDMRAYGGIRYSEHEIFSNIEWQTDDDLDIKHALFDINNDGENELVIYNGGMLRGIPVDDLFIYPADSDVLSKLKPGAGGLHVLFDNPNRLFSTNNNVYYLKDSPKTMGAWAGVYFVLNPFILEGTSYISITDQTPRWIVIAKYKQAEELQDICYFADANIGHQF